MEITNLNEYKDNKDAEKRKDLEAELQELLKKDKELFDEAVAKRRLAEKRFEHNPERSVEDLRQDFKEIMGLHFGKEQTELTKRINSIQNELGQNVTENEGTLDWFAEGLANKEKNEREELKNKFTTV